VSCQVAVFRSRGSVGKAWIAETREISGMLVGLRSNIADT